MAGESARDRYAHTRGGWPWLVCRLETREGVASHAKEDVEAAKNKFVEATLRQRRGFHGITATSRVMSIAYTDFLILYS